MEVELYDGDNLHGVAKQKVSTIIKSVDLLKEMKDSLKADATQHFTSINQYPMFNGSKPMGLLQMEYVFMPALHNNTFEKGVDAEYALDKHEHVFEEARLLKPIPQPGCFNFLCCMKYTAAISAAGGSTTAAILQFKYGGIT